MIKRLTFMTLATGLVWSQWASAENGLVDYARVDAVSPVFQVVEERIPKETCWTDRVREEVHHPGHKPNNGKVVGGVLGGALGHAVGHGSDNKKIGAFVGTILGTTIGHQSDQQAARPSRTTVNYRNVERCKIQEVVESRREIVGYDVTYTYDNRQFTTRMKRQPGEKIKVAVYVEPLAE